MNERKLTRSEWTARWRGEQPNTIYLDYEGVAWKRSQSVIRYKAGHYGWDWPEVVPDGVKGRVARLFESLHGGES